MTSRIAQTALLLIAFIVLQLALFTRLYIFGVHPDILLVLSLCIGLCRGARSGLAAGFVFGLLHDIFLTTPMGLSALGYAIAGYFVGSISEGADELPWVTVTLSVVGSVLALTMYLVVGSIIHDVHVVRLQALRIVIVIALSNALIAPFLVRLLRVMWPVSADTKVLW